MRNNSPRAFIHLFQLLNWTIREQIGEFWRIFQRIKCENWAISAFCVWKDYTWPRILQVAQCVEQSTYLFILMINYLQTFFFLHLHTPNPYRKQNTTPGARMILVSIWFDFNGFCSSTAVGYIYIFSAKLWKLKWNCPNIFPSPKWKFVIIKTGQWCRMNEID